MWGIHICGGMADWATRGEGGIGLDHAAVCKHHDSAVDMCVCVDGHNAATVLQGLRPAQLARFPHQTLWHTAYALGLAILNLVESGLPRSEQLAVLHDI